MATINYFSISRKEIAFNRSSEDTSLLFKKRPARNAKNAAIKKKDEVEEVHDEDLLERTDSNVIWGLLSFCSKSKENIGRFLDILGGRS